jgi:spore germination protein GerM
MVKWILLTVLTLGLLAGSWYLYILQPFEEAVEVELPSHEELSTTIPLDPATIRAHEVTLFVGDPETGTLLRHIGNIDANLNGMDAMTETVKQLLHPGEDVRNYAIPEGTELLSLFMTNAGIVYLNVNRNLQDQHIGGMAAELATVTSLINTLFFNFKEIRQVQILVEGAEIETLAGHIDCRKPFSKMLLLQDS